MLEYVLWLQRNKNVRQLFTTQMKSRIDYKVKRINGAKKVAECSAMWIALVPCPRSWVGMSSTINWPPIMLIVRLMQKRLAKANTVILMAEPSINKPDLVVYGFQVMSKKKCCWKHHQESVHPSFFDFTIHPVQLIVNSSNNSKTFCQQLATLYQHQN